MAETKGETFARWAEEAMNDARGTPQITAIRGLTWAVLAVNETLKEAFQDG